MKSPAKRSAEISRGAATESPAPRGRFSLQPTAKPATTVEFRPIRRPENQTATPRQKPGIKPREIENSPKLFSRSGPTRRPFRKRRNFTWVTMATATGICTAPLSATTKTLTTPQFATGSRNQRRPAVSPAWRCLPASSAATVFRLGISKPSSHIRRDPHPGTSLKLLAPQRDGGLHGICPTTSTHDRPTKKEEIPEWVRRVIIRSSTDYRRFQAAAMKQRYAIRFPGITYAQSEEPSSVDGLRTWEAPTVQTPAR